MIRTALLIATLGLLLSDAGVCPDDQHNHEDEVVKSATPAELAVVQSLKDAKTLVVYRASFVYDLATQPPRLFGTLWLVNQSAGPVGGTEVGGLHSEALHLVRYAQLPESGANLSSRIPQSALEAGEVVGSPRSPLLRLKLKKPLKPKEHSVIYIDGPLEAFAQVPVESAMVARTPQLPSPALTVAVTLIVPSGVRIDPEGSPGESNLNRRLIGSEAAGFAPDQERLATAACILAGRILPAEQERFMYLWWPVPFGKVLIVQGRLISAAAAHGGLDGVTIGVLVGLGVLALVWQLAKTTFSRARAN
jgi:hypothetical protein